MPRTFPTPPLLGGPESGGALPAADERLLKCLPHPPHNIECTTRMGWGLLKEAQERLRAIEGVPAGDHAQDERDRDANPTHDLLEFMVTGEPRQQKKQAEQSACYEALVRLEVWAQQRLAADMWACSVPPAAHEVAPPQTAPAPDARADAKAAAEAARQEAFLRKLPAASRATVLAAADGALIARLPPDLRQEAEEARGGPRTRPGTALTAGAPKRRTQVALAERVTALFRLHPADAAGGGW
eukprot:gene19083-36561_t